LAKLANNVFALVVLISVISMGYTTLSNGIIAPQRRRGIKTPLFTAIDFVAGVYCYVTASLYLAKCTCHRVAEVGSIYRQAPWWAFPAKLGLGRTQSQYRVGPLTPLPLG
jgi:hypothetical protein